VLGEGLKERGRVIVLRESAITSGRKLRDYPAWKLLRVLVATLRGGEKSLMQRQGLDSCYNQRGQVI